jgi:hypothetical protein
MSVIDLKVSWRWHTGGHLRGLILEVDEKSCFGISTSPPLKIILILLWEEFLLWELRVDQRARRHWRMTTWSKSYKTEIAGYSLWMQHESKWWVRAGKTIWQGLGGLAYSPVSIINPLWTLSKSSDFWELSVPINKKKRSNYSNGF